MDSGSGQKSLMDEQLDENIDTVLPQTNKDAVDGNVPSMEDLMAIPDAQLWSDSYVDHIARAPMCHNFWHKMQCCRVYGGVNDTRPQLMIWNMSEQDVGFINSMFEDVIESMELHGIRQYLNEGTVVCDLYLENDGVITNDLAFMTYVQIIVYGVRERFNRLSPLFYVSDLTEI